MRLDPFLHPELLTCAEMARADAAAVAAGTPGIVLMERAGAAVAYEAERMVRASGRIVVLCGPGNNGGDGFTAARLLAERGYRVDLGLLGARDALRGDAALAAARFGGVAHAADANLIKGAALIVDALFGSGLTRPLEGEALALVEAISASATPVLSVDLPSGVNGDTGEVLGGAPHATRTITFHRLKRGHVLLPGADLCGDLRLHDIGLTASGATGASVIAPGLWRSGPLIRSRSDHKYVRGAVLVLSGPAHRTGAARLAAGAALRAGAGVVALASPLDAVAANAAHATAVMLEPFSGLAGFARLASDERRRAFVIGPGAGVGEDTRAMTRIALGTGRFCVIDADALTSFAGQVEALAGHLRETNASAVLTPHEGEFRRLFGDTPQYNGENGKIERTIAAARFAGCVVLLKGSDTVVAAPDGRVAVSLGAPTRLATAGSGDVLAGLIAGLGAQVLDAFEAAVAGVWMHARAGDAAGPGMTAEDLLRAASPALLGARGAA